MEKEFNYVYITTNLINGKQYVGDHSTNNLDDKYIGSGRRLLPSIKKYGRNNFKKEILEFFPTKQEAFDLQEKYINEYNTLVPNGYNISPKGGHNVKGCFSEESKIKMSKTKTGHKHSEETKEKIRLSSLGKKMSDESKQKMGNIHKGVKTWNTGKTLSKEIKQKMSESHKGKSPWNKGKTLSDEHKEKISQQGKIWITNDNDNKMCFPNCIPIGWKKGRKIKRVV